MTTSRLPADKKRKLLTRVEDTTNPAYGRIPQERSIPELFRDGIINLEDYSVLSQTWQGAQSQTTVFDARVDFNRDGLINAKDLIFLADCWLDTSPVKMIP